MCGDDGCCRLILGTSPKIKCHHAQCSDWLKNRCAEIPNGDWSRERGVYMSCNVCARVRMCVNLFVVCVTCCIQVAYYGT